MTKITFFLLLLVSCICLPAQYAGYLDASFGINGKTTTSISNDDDVATCMTLQPDGKIILGGFTGSGTMIDFALIRYNTDGSIDNSFGTNGIATASFDSPNAGSDIIAALNLQADGKIVAVGTTKQSSITQACIARFDSNGTLESSFNNNIGYYFAGTANYYLFPTGVKIMGNGKIIVTGTFEGSFAGDFFIIKLNADGTPDITFGNNGMVVTPLENTGYPDNSYAMEMQLDGKLVMVGSNLQYFSEGLTFVIARLNNDGQLDPNFNTVGFVRLNITFFGDDIAYNVAVQPDGKIVAVGTLNEGTANSDFLIVRCNGDGSMDNSFGTNGIVTTDFIGGIDGAREVLIQSDGKIIAIGYATANGAFRFGLARYNPNGSLDNTFGVNGKITTDISAGEDVAYSAALQTDGKLLVAGESYTVNTGKDFAVARYLTTPGVGFVENENNIAAYIYPNPVSDKATIHFNLTEKTSLSIAITDLQGKVIKEIQNKLPYTSGNQEFSFDTKELSNGCYLLSIQSDNHTQYCKLIK